MLLQATTGNENFPNGSAKLMLFGVPTRDHPIGKETFIDQLARTPGAKLPVRLQGQTKRDAAPGYRREMGEWKIKTYDIPAGAILKLFGQRTGSWTSMKVNASIYIRLRETAPLQRVSAILTGWENAALAEAPVEGRFDILTQQDLADEGININPWQARFLEPHLVRQMFRVTQLDQELAPKPTFETKEVETTEGETRKVRLRKRKRAIDLD